jgi:hypothetical protein
MPQKADLEAFEGEDVVFPFVIKNSAQTAVEDITGWAITLTVKTFFDQSTATLTKTATVTDGPAGLCQVACTRTNLTLTPRTYAYDLSRTDSGSDSCLVYGYLHLKDRSR